MASHASCSAVLALLLVVAVRGCWAGRQLVQMPQPAGQSGGGGECGALGGACCCPHYNSTAVADTGVRCCKDDGAWCMSVLHNVTVNGASVVRNDDLCFKANTAQASAGWLAICSQVPALALPAEALNAVCAARCAVQCGGDGQPCCVDAVPRGWSQSFNRQLSCHSASTPNVSQPLQCSLNLLSWSAVDLGLKTGGGGMLPPSALGTCQSFLFDKCGQPLGPCWGQAANSEAAADSGAACSDIPPGLDRNCPAG